MSFSIGALANGLANASDRIQQQQRYNEEIKRRDEQEKYNRNRQAVADQQAAQLHEQQVKRQDQLIANGLRENEEYNRVKGLQGMIGQLQQYKQTGDTDGAFRSATDYMNQYNANNTEWNQDHVFAFTKDASNPDAGMGALNIVDRNTGQIVRQVNGGMSTDNLIDMFYGQINPIGVVEAQKQAAAKAAETESSRNWDLQKMGVQAGYEQQKSNAKFKNDLELEKYKFGNQSQMEQFKQGQENYRAGLNQDGQNYRAEISAAGKGSGLSEKTQKAVSSGVNGAIQFAEQNAPMLSFLSNDPDAYLKTMAMMGIESGGRNIPSYNGTSQGYMQLHKKYAQGFANQFGVKGNPLVDPQANIQTGAALVKHLDKKYSGDPSLIAAAYNAGEPAIDNALKAWKKAGQKGGWFDYLNISDAAKNEAYNHVLKYNHALSLLGGQQQKVVNQGQEQYVKGATQTATSSIKTVATKMAGELGLEKQTAPVLGALAGAQGEITKFANATTTAARSKAFDNIAMMVENAVKNTEAGAVMTPQARRQYILQYASELVGASNKTEAGLWISDPKKKQIAQQEANRPQATMDEQSINDLLGVASPTKAKVVAPLKDGVPVTLRRPEAVTSAVNSFASNAVKNGLANLK